MPLINESEQSNQTIHLTLEAPLRKQTYCFGPADGGGVRWRVHAVSEARARALLKEAGVSGLSLTMKLPPVPYARQGGEVIAAMLAKVDQAVVALESLLRGLLASLYRAFARNRYKMSALLGYKAPACGSGVCEIGNPFLNPSIAT